MAYTVAQAISEIQKAFRQRDPRELRKVNDRCIESIALGFNKDIYNLAILSYALSKILQKPRYWERRNVAEFIKQLEADMKACAEDAAAGKAAEFSSRIGKCIALIDRLEATDRRFVRQPIEKAKLKIAATLYAQGFSLGSASQLTGMDKREILSYAGRTMMFDRVKSELPISERLKKVRKIFAK